MNRTFSRWYIAMGIIIPLWAADAVQAGQAPGSSNTAFRLEINFETGSAVVKPEFDKEIRKVTDYLKANPAAVCEIRGYTDNVGSDAVNLTISQQRADSVRLYMIDKLGIAATRLKAYGYGNADPIATNDTEEGRRQNRRMIAQIL